MFGTYDARLYPRVAVIRAGLRNSGLIVDECNEPVSMSKAEGAEALWKPWRLLPLGVRVFGAWIRLWRRGRRVERPEIVLIGYPGSADVHLARRLWPDATLVLGQPAFVGDASGHRGFGRKLLGRLVDGLGRAAVRTADVTLVDTPENLELIPAELRKRCVVVPIGAGDEWFQPLPARPPGPLRVVFFGLYTPQHGAPTIGAAIRLCAAAGIEFTMVGRGRDRAVTASAVADTGVTWLDSVATEELPRVVAAHDVALGIFGCKDKARRVVPSKVYQGAAAGCAIVTSRTAPQVRMLGDAAEYVPCGDAESLASALMALAQNPARVAALRLSAHQLAARRFKPAVVVEPLLDALGLRVGK